MEIGYVVSVMGAAIVATLSGVGSAYGVSIPARAANGLLSEEPEKFGNTLILVALPGSQGIYGFISGVMVLITIGAMGGQPKSPTLLQGLAILGVCLFQTAVQWISSVLQAKVCAAGIAIVAKHPEDSMKGVVNAVMVETYAVLGLLITLLLLLFAIGPQLK
jgi:V/A-type H+-transporting ATPase subunit K